jgi:hypothetical protein
MMDIFKSIIPLRELGLSLFLMTAMLEAFWHLITIYVMIPLGEFLEAECGPCDPCWQKDFLADVVLFEELPDDGYLQEYNSTGEYLVISFP